MSDSLESSELGIVVPVHLDAFCVGKNDETNDSFSGPTSKYPTESWEERWLWKELNIPLFHPPNEKKLQSGIHLHWALPDALTTAALDPSTGKLNFPEVPNRWLVTRFLFDGDKPPKTKSWVVQSDYLSDEDNGAVALRNLKKDKEYPEAVYLGRCVELEQFEESDENHSCHELTKTSFSAVTSGVASFAAYYPDCHSVFGFHDSLEGVDPQKVMYTVVGWYSNSQSDPIGMKELAELKWVHTSEKKPSYSLYLGSVQGINWDPNVNYTSKESLSPIEAHISIGNHPTEAITAFFREQEGVDHPLYDHLVHAVHSGSHTSLDETPDIQFDLLEKSHLSEFSLLDGGWIHSVRKEEEKEPKMLSPQVKEKLREGNNKQNQRDLLKDLRESMQSQLFADWRHIYRTDSASLVASMRAEDVKNLQREEEKEDLALDQHVKEYGDLHWIKRPAARFVQPNDPVVSLIHGGRGSKNDLMFSDRHGKDGRHTAEGLLVCRLTDQIVSKVKIQDRQMEKKLKFAGLNRIPHSSEIQSLLEESTLLNLSILKAFFPTSSLTVGDLRHLMKKKKTPLSTVGEPPSSITLTFWEKNPWHPLFLSWEVTFYPYQKTFDKDEGVLEYSEQFVKSSFDLSYGTDGYFQPKQDAKTSGEPQKYRGHSIVSHLPKDSLAQTLSEYLESQEDPCFEKFQKQLENSTILVQPLSGLNNLFLMRSQSLEIKPSAIRALTNSHFKNIHEDVANSVGQKTGLGIDEGVEHNPIRAGHFKLSLSLVGLFGQRREISSAHPESPLICAKSLLDGDKPYLPPRISQPARLVTNWLPANHIGEAEMNGEPLSTPVCGWLLPNHLTKELFLYNAEGEILGSFGLRNGVPTLSPPPGKSSDVHLEDQNLLFAQFIVSIKNEEQFNELWKAVEWRSNQIHKQIASAKGNLAVLIGAPIALMQAALRLEVQGIPALNQKDHFYEREGFYQAHTHGFEKVQFPILLGNLSRKYEGLVGFYPSRETGKYAFGSLERSGLSLPISYPMKTEESSATIQPARKVLMLVDPRAPVHITSGILPTQKLEILPIWVEEAMAQMGMSFYIGPILRPRNLQKEDPLHLPIPTEEGFQCSWITKSGKENWEVAPDIEPISDQRQFDSDFFSLAEGWLHFTPNVLEFSLVNEKGKSLFSIGSKLFLRLINRTKKEIVLDKGKLVREEEKKEGAIAYIHLGKNVAFQLNESLKDVSIAIQGDTRAVVFLNKQVLPPGKEIVIELGEITSVEENKIQSTVYLKYYNIQGIDDGVAEDVISLDTQRGERI